MEKGTISIAFVEAVLDGLDGKGIDTDSLLRKSGISPALLNLPNARVSPPTYTMLLRLIAQALDDEFFGQDSRRMKVGSFAMLCHSIIHCKTLDKALRRTLRFYALMLDDLRGTLSHDHNQVRLTLLERNPEAPARLFAQENLLLFIHRLACWLINRRIPIASAAFRYPEPAHGGEYPALFCRRLQFGAPLTGITFDPKYLELPVVRSEAALKDFLRLAPENLLVQYKDTQSIGTRVKRRLMEVPPSDWPSFETVAKSLNTSASSLRRALEAEGQSYQLIKDRVRRDMAINLLSESTMSVMTVAAELGFAEASAFHRAFKKWTGACPGEYRRSGDQRVQ